jgi:site-specific recombinase XerD
VSLVDQLLTTTWEHEFRSRPTDFTRAGCSRRSGSARFRRSEFAAAKITGKSAHSLRHTFATSLLARTGDLRMVQTAMCHASVVSTCVYTHVDRERLRAAVGS